MLSDQGLVIYFLRERNQKMARPQFKLFVKTKKMEIFIDGGLFELIVFLGFGYVLNFLLKKIYLLIFYCVLAISAPLIILFLQEGWIKDSVVAFNVLNVGVFVFLLLDHYREKKDEPLINLSRYRKKLPSFFRKKLNLK